MKNIRSPPILYKIQIKNIKLKGSKNYETK